MIGPLFAEEASAMLFFESVLLRLVLWIGLPVLLAVLAIGPGRTWRAMKKAWNWLWNRRLDPEEVLTRVVTEHEKHVAALRAVLSRSETAEAEILHNLRTSESNIAALEKEASQMAQTGDDLGARAVLYKLNLERAAVESFRTQLERQRTHIADVRRHLYLMELQKRQYEVGRSILLSQLAEAKSVEQQAAIAAQFDPFHAVSSWQQAEGMVQEKALNAKAAERVYADLLEMPLSSQPPQVDPAALEAQLAELKGRLRKVHD
jgi:phage shock protein A